MKTIESLDLLAKAARFAEICQSLGSMAESVDSEKKDTTTPYKIELAAAYFSELRADLGAPQYRWPDNTGLLVANDYFAMSRLAAQIGVGSVQCDINGEGRVFGLSLSKGPKTIDEIGLLNELQKLSIEKYGEADPSQLANCLKLNSICLKGMDSQMQTLESVMEKMPWVASIEVHGSQSMRLNWVRNHRELTRLNVSGLGIDELTPLQNCVNLKFLNISNNPVRSLDPLNSLPRLRELDIRGTSITDFSGLYHLNSTCYVTISANMTCLPGFKDLQYGMLAGGGKVKISDRS